MSKKTAYLRFVSMTVGLALSIASWAEITVGVDNLSVTHKNSKGMSIVFPDVCKTPTPPGPIPIPYPGIAQGSDENTESRRTKIAAPEKPITGARQRSSSSTATTMDTTRFALETMDAGNVHIRQTAGRDSVTTATYVDAKGNKLQLREHALIKLANGDLCAICAGKDGRVTAVYRLLPDKQQRKTP